MKLLSSVLLSLSTLFLLAVGFAAHAQTNNTPPHLDINVPLTVVQGGTAVITSDYLAATDAESSPSGIIFTIDTNSVDGSGGPPREGLLLKDGVPLGYGGTFTMDDINQQRVTYQQTSQDCATNDDFQAGLTDDMGGVWTDQGHTLFTFRINILQVDRPPVPYNQSLSVPLGGAVQGTLTATNPDCLAQTLTYSLGSAPAKGSVTLLDTNTGAFRYTANPGQTGNDSFSFQVFDGRQLAVQPGTVTLAIQNQAPVAQAAGFSVRQGQVLSATLTATDVDLPAQSLTFSLASLPSKGTVTLTDASTGGFRYTPQSGRFGTDSFTFRANDGQADSAPAQITVVIHPNMLAAGSLLVSDTASNSVLLVSPTNGDALMLSQGGLIAKPTGVAYESGGTVLVADQNNGLIRLNPGTGAQIPLVAHSQLPFPIGLALESSGNILVADPSAGVMRFNPAGTLLAHFPAGSLIAPAGIVVTPTGQIVVSDAAALFGNPAATKIMAIDPVTFDQTLLSATGLLTAPVSLALEPSGSLLSMQFMADQLVRVSGSAQSPLTSGSNLQGAFGVGVDASGNIFVASQKNSAVVQVDPVTGAQTVVSLPGTLGQPFGLAVVGPTAPARILGLTRDTGGTVNLQLAAPAGALGTVLGATSLGASSWQELGPAVESAPGVFHFTDSGAPVAPVRFYRLRLP